MPSPSSPILITVLPSKWIEPLEGSEGRLYLSESIPIGESITIDGELKAWIKMPESTTKIGTSLCEADAVSLRATMPWLDQKLDGFTFKRDFVVQYPLELVGFNILRSLVPASKNKLTVKVSHLG